MSGFLLWGAFPLYWKQMQSVSAFELIMHRIVWSLLFLLVLVGVQRGFSTLKPAFASMQAVGWNLLSALLLTANWLIYVWAVNGGHVVESSLGYFLVPLVNVALGAMMFHEQMRRLQWLAVIAAAIGVSLLLFRVGHVPWIALSIAGTWAGYGLLKRKSALGAIAGLTVETLLLFPFAAGCLLWWQHTGTGALGHVDARTHLFILGAGVVTAVPLLLFSFGARSIRFTTLGLLQYLSPTVQFLVGVVVYHELLDAARLQCYAFIWAGLVVYTADSFWQQRHALLRVAGTK